MSEGLKKLVDEMGKEAIKKYGEKIRSFIEEMKEKVKIKLPQDVLKILAEGGIIEAGEINTYQDDLIGLRFADKDVLWRKGEGPKLFQRDGKYKWYLIVKRVGDREEKEG